MTDSQVQLILNKLDEVKAAIRALDVSHEISSSRNVLAEVRDAVEDLKPLLKTLSEKP